MRIDHVVLGSKDLDLTAERFADEYRLMSVPGGRHAAWGTANRIVPLGDDYVEFLAVVDQKVADRSRLGTLLRRSTAEGDRWFVVCMQDDDLDGTAERLGMDIVTGSRTRPDGRELRWRSAGLEDPSREPWLPFFIDWQVPPADHPGATLMKDAPIARGIAWVEIAGDAGRMQEWLGGADVPIRMVRDEPAGVRAVALGTAAGEIVI